MQISATTRNILKNFASINTNLMIAPGKAIRTMSTDSSVFATVEVAEEFPQEIAIYDLPNFLSILSVDKDATADFDFGTHAMKIRMGGAEVDYKYADPSIIVAPPSSGTITVTPIYEFSLGAQEIKDMVRFANILKATSFTVESDGATATICVNDLTNEASNSYKRVIGECNVVMKAVMDINRLNLIDDDYAATVAQNNFMHFAGKTTGAQYFITLSTDSELPS